MRGHLLGWVTGSRGKSRPGTLEIHKQTQQAENGLVPNTFASILFFTGSYSALSGRLSDSMTQSSSFSSTAAIGSIERTSLCGLGKKREKMINYNYEVAARHYSYSILRTRLNAILSYFFGDSAKDISDNTSFLKQKDDTDPFGLSKKTARQSY